MLQQQQELSLSVQTYTACRAAGMYPYPAGPEKETSTQVNLQNTPELDHTSEYAAPPAPSQPLTVQGGYVPRSPSSLTHLAAHSLPRLQTHSLTNRPLHQSSLRDDRLTACLLPMQ